MFPYELLFYSLIISSLKSKFLLEFLFKLTQFNA